MLGQPHARECVPQRGAIGHLDRFVSSRSDCRDRYVWPSEILRHDRVLVKPYEGIFSPHRFVDSPRNGYNGGGLLGRIGPIPKELKGLHSAKPLVLAVSRMEQRGFEPLTS